MGFMDNIKNAQEMAKQAQEAAGQMAPGMGGMSMDAEDMAYAQTVQRISTGGIPCVATIESITETGKTDAGGGAKQYALGVEIEKPGEAPYKATIKQYLQPDAVSSYQPGGRFDAKVDPQDPSQGVLYGFAS